MAENIQAFLSSFQRVRRVGNNPNQYKCLCPAHNDKNASLSIKYDPKADKIVLCCHAGCRTEDVLAEVGKTWADIQPESETKKKTKPKWHFKYVDGSKYELVAEYPYRDVNGRYLYSKLRYENEDHSEKTFRFGRVINGECKFGSGNEAPTLYNLPELSKAIEKGKTIYYVEGEKDVLTLRKHGIVAVSAGSVSDWKSSFSEYFIGASEVVIIADRDKPGEELAKRVSNDLRSVVYQHKVIEPSGKSHGDITDFLTEEDGTIEDLFEIVKNAAPIMASWRDSKGKIHPDLLASEFMKRNYLFIATNAGTKSDIIYLYRNGVYHETSENDLSREIRKWIPKGFTKPDSINQAVKMITYSANTRSYEELNADERFINVQNGLLDIYSGELKSHSPELISSLQIKSNFVQEATAPKWERFIESLCYNPVSDEIDREMVSALQEWTGFILSPIYGYRIKKCLLLYSARGNSGKSVFLTILSALLGTDATANVDFESLGSSRWATGRAFGKRLLSIGDEGGESISSSQNFKQMTGGDMVEAERKGIQGFDYRFRGVICAACNLLPFFIDDKGDHIIERFYFLNCRHTIPAEKRDPMYADKLLDEKEGIFAWAMEGLQRFIDNGMRFSKCESSRILTDEYRARHDSVYAFMLDHVEKTENRSDYIPRTEFDNRYLMYCEERDLNGMNRKNIPSRLASMGITVRNHSRKEVYSGIRWRQCD